MEYNASLGICSVVFGPEVDDLGQWSCIFKIDDWEIASASLVLLTTPPGKLMSNHWNSVRVQKQDIFRCH